MDGSPSHSVKSKTFQRPIRPQGLLLLTASSAPVHCAHSMRPWQPPCFSFAIAKPTSTLGPLPLLFSLLGILLAQISTCINVSLPSNHLRRDTCSSHASQSSARACTPTSRDPQNSLPCFVVLRHTYCHMMFLHDIYLGRNKLIRQFF